MDYAALVRKRIEAFFAVVAAHAALPYAAERQHGGGKMDYGIVHAATAEGAAVQQPALGGLVHREYIKRKGLGTAVDKGYNFTQRIKAQHGQHGTKYLLLHNGRIGRNVA